MTLSQNATGRDYGVDLLRILSMMMIVVLHMITAGGLRDAADGYAVSHSMIWLLNAATTCAVNVYGLISGYIGCTARPRAANLMYLWCQTAFYSLGIFCVFARVQGLSLLRVLTALTPVMSNCYWYFTAYVALFFFMPALNHLILTLPRKALLLLGLSCVMLFSVIPALGGQDLFYTKQGYSFLWLFVLYLLGGICRKLDLFQGVRAGKALALVMLCCLVNLICRDIFLRFRMFSQMYMLFEYTAPVTLLTSISMLALFAGRRLPSFAIALVRRLSPLTFGVYLIHVHPLVFSRLFHNQLAGLLQFRPAKMLAAIGLIFLGIWAACTAIDAIRLRLFQLLRVRQLCEWTEQKAAGIVNRHFK